MPVSAWALVRLPWPLFLCPFIYLPAWLRCLALCRPLSCRLVGSQSGCWGPSCLDTCFPFVPSYLTAGPLSEDFGSHPFVSPMISLLVSSFLLGSGWAAGRHVACTRGTVDFGSFAFVARSTCLFAVTCVLF